MLYKKYKDIPEKYKFDLEDLLENQTIEKLIEKYIFLKKDEIKYKDSKYETAESFLYFKNIEKQNELLYNKIYNYVSNKLNINNVDPYFNKISEEFEIELDKINKELGSETNRAIKNIDKLTLWMNLPEFKNYRNDIKALIEFKQHKLSDEIEEYLLRVAKADADFSEIFQILTDVEMDFGYAISSKNKKIKITEGNYFQLLKSKDKLIRKTTYHNYLDAFYKNRESLTRILKNQFTKISVEAKERKYQSAVNFLTSDDKVNSDILLNLYENIKKLKPLVTKFYKYKKLFYQKKFNETPKSYDMNVDLVKVKNNYSVEQAQEIILKALKPMGEEYINICQKMFKDRWIDYFNVENKTSGAYSIDNTYGLNKIYISMNWNNTWESVSTLAHEIGHSLHSYFSNQNQPYELADYPIILAEIASTFNELMLNDYLFNNSNNKKIKFKVLEQSISDFISTVIKQTFWSNYEFQIYNLIDNNHALSSFKDFEQVYNEIEKQYFSSKNRDYKNSVFAIAVPHFYYDFYVYKYAIGYIVANHFFTRYKEKGISEIENYFTKFLTQGGSDWPLQILLNSNIDLSKNNFYQNSFKQFKKNIENYIKIGKELFKN
ncbi:oligoendopeptidase F [Mesomycoplasma lagogenitalium]|uniref:Oligopeptidase F n=1 Tax=Mesomycoplasma lagogenitalium TaxID=171286 RepID=A0ABY8LUX0_9BACT|nr:oligoendopeptidase F [Mesomycoplasma lagogenitalium]WGI36343.1 oligoendopeptidase F [Mesomycoplasma lagogenitalium]